MLSLKKASKVGEGGWTSGTLSRAHQKTITQIAFGGPPIGPEDSSGAASDEVGLSDLSDKQVGGRSGEGLYGDRYQAGFELWPGETCSGCELATVAPPLEMEIGGEPGAADFRLNYSF